MDIYIIVGTVLAILGIIGATQRQNIKTWVRSETKYFVDNNTNTVKVAKLKLSDLKVKKKEIVNTAGELFGLEGLQKKQLKTLLDKSTTLLIKATDAKKDNKKESAIEYIKLKKETDKQIELVKENIDTLSKRRTALEVDLQKINTYIATSDIRLEGLASRKAVNNVLKDVKTSSFSEDTLDETLNNTEESIIKDELKLDYLSEESSEVENSAELDAEYDSL